MEKKEYLNEENFQQVNNKIKSKGKLITNITLGIGIALILTGVILLIINKRDNNSNNNNNSNNENLIKSQIVAKENEIEAEKENLKTKLSEVKADLNTKKQALLAKGIKESHNYNDGEAYDLYILDNVLDPSFSHCSFDEYQNNELTKDYCTLTNVINDKSHYYTCENNEIIEKYCTLTTELAKLRNDKFWSSDIDIEIETKSFAHIPLIMIGFFVTVVSLMAKFMLFSVTHRREIAAYTAQQVMPLAQEGIEKMAPTVGKAGRAVFEEIAPAVTEVGKKMAKEMAPVYGEMAKEISKGIKEGLKDEEK